MVEKMRAEITALGGEIRFEQRVDDLHIENKRVTGVTLATGEKITSNYIALAIGHSARDTFEMLVDKGVYVKAKPFSIGTSTGSASITACCLLVICAES